MKKLINKEKYFNICIFIIIFIASLSVILLKQLNDLDELWNYNFARNISKGLIPYKDFNMVVPPLTALIGGLVLKITTDQLIIIRILAVILITTILYFIYKIFYLLKVKKEISIIFLSIFFCLFQYRIAFDYNWATLLMSLIILYCELKFYIQNNNIFEVDFTREIILGLVSGMAIMCKQTAGILIAFFFIFNKCIFIKNKEDIKKYIKIFIYRLVGILIPVLLCIIYLMVNNAFYDFISYTIKGTREFTNYYSYINLIKFDTVGIFATLIPITIILEILLLLMKKRSKLEYFILIYSICMLIILFPISDNMHFIIGATPSILLLLYEIYKFLYKHINYKRNIVKMICVYISTFITIFICFYTFNNFYKYVNSKEQFSNIYQYKNIIISDNIRCKINNVIDYMLKTEKDIKILNAEAVTYMIPINRYNKDYDMFNKGNFGENGEARLIEDIKKSYNRQYLIIKDKYISNWQTPTSIIEYVKGNKNKVGNIAIFDIYE